MELQNIGQIARLSVPDSWTREEVEFDGGIGTRRCIEFQGDGNFRLSLFYRGLPIDADSANYLSNLLTRKPAVNGPAALTVDEIVALSLVFGLSTVGDNQYANPTPPGDEGGRAFRIDRAETINLKQRTVLWVKGTFSSGTNYCGIFTQSHNDARVIEEVFLESGDSANFDDYEWRFIDVLNSIEWADISFAPV